MDIRKLPVLAAAALAATASLASAQDHVIATAPAPFNVSFRGAAGATYFGWGTGTFDGVTDDEVIDNPATTLGETLSGVALTQLTTGDILASSNNVYNGAGASSRPGALQLIIPTNGTVGAGFTTIIVQGQAATGGPSGGSLTTVPGFGTINGITPTFVWGGNSGNALQWWAKYELPGNASTYNLQISLNGGSGIGPTSVANLQVDTFWSATGYAGDQAFATPPSPTPPPQDDPTPNPTPEPTPITPTPTPTPTPEAAAVNQPPILSVAGKSTRTVGPRTSRVTVQGAAFDETGIAGVYYAIGTGDLRTAAGTENWTIDTRIASDRTVIRVFTVDATGQLSASRRIVIQRR